MAIETRRIKCETRLGIKYEYDVTGDWRVGPPEESPSEVVLDEAEARRLWGVFARDGVQPLVAHASCAYAGAAGLYQVVGGAPELAE